MKSKKDMKNFSANKEDMPPQVGRSWTNGIPWGCQGCRKIKLVEKQIPRCIMIRSTIDVGMCRCICIYIFMFVIYHVSHVICYIFVFAIHALFYFTAKPNNKGLRTRFFVVNPGVSMSPHKACGLNMFEQLMECSNLQHIWMCSCWSWWCCGLSCWWSCGRYLHHWRTTTLNHLGCVLIILFMGMWQVVSPICTSPMCRHVPGGIDWLIYW